MSATGIGQSVRRVEDFRFITGNGNYTDDITRPGQTHAYFVRSPHAHATIKSIDTSTAEKAPGVVGILTGKELAAGQDRRPHLRLDDPFERRLADESGRPPSACGR